MLTLQQCEVKCILLLNNICFRKSFKICFELLSIWIQLHQTRYHLKNCSWGDVVCNFLHSMVKSAPEGDQFASHWLRKALKWVDNCFQLKGCPRYLFSLFPIYSLICDVHVWNSRTTYIHLLKQLYYSNILCHWPIVTQVSMLFVLQHLWTEPGPSAILSAKPKGSTRFGELRALRSPGALLRVCLPGSRVGCESVKTVLGSVDFDQFHRATPGALEAPIWNTK